MKRPSEYMTMTDGVTQHDYKQALNKYIDYLEAQAKQLILSGVSQQRELLCVNCECKPTQKLGFCNECFDNIYSNA